MASVPPLLLIGTAVLCLGNLLHIIGIGTVHWTEHTEPSLRLSFYQVNLPAYNAGLFVRCPDVNNCTDTSTLEAVRALVIIGMLGGLLSAALAILFTLFKLLSKSPPKILTVVSGFAAVGAFALISIGIIVYAVQWNSNGVGNLGYSFYLSCVGAVLLAIGGLLFFVGGRKSVDA